MRCASSTGFAARSACTTPASAYASACSPSRLTAEMLNTRRPRASRSGVTSSARSRRLGDVDLVEHDEPRALGEPGDVVLVERQLALDGLEVAERVAARLEGRAVEHVDEHRAALDVAQELQAQALAGVGAGDQAGDVGDGERRAAGLDDAEVRHQRRERVVGDLRPGGGQRGDEARLAGAREADERDVGDALELEHDVADVAGLAEQREARAPCAWRSRASRCRGRPCRPWRRRSCRPRRRGRRAGCRPRRRRRCRSARAPRGRRPWRRCASSPAPACPRWPCGAGGSGGRAATSCSSARRGSRRRRHRRRRRRGRRAA